MNDNQVILCPNPAVPSLPSKGNPFTCCSGLMQRGSEISPENVSGGGQRETEWEVGGLAGQDPRPKSAPCPGVLMRTPVG